MTGTTVTERTPSSFGDPGDPGRSTRDRVRSWLIWGAVAVVLVAISVIWIVATDLRPSYDPFGWLDWGQQVLSGNFNTNGAPSWKPLTFIFTLPYGLFGRNPQMWLWMITATASALAGSVVAGRLSYELTGPTPGRPWAPWAAALFAGIGLLGMTGYSQLIMIANSDPMIVTLCLLGVYWTLHRRLRLAFLALVFASLGRPEVWAFTGLFAVWAWFAQPDWRTRLLLFCGCLFVPLAWFIVPGLTSASWLHPGALAMGSHRAIHGSKIVGVFDRTRQLFAVPVQLAIAFALAFAVIRRERRWLWVAGAALLWILIELAFAYHGWSAVIRYLVEPGALLIVLAGAAIGRLLGWIPPGPRVLRLAPFVLILALLVGLIPGARFRARVVRYEIRVDRHAANELNRLEGVIATEGAAKMKSCGQPATLLGYQSELAWAIGMNVGNVSFRPGKSIAAGKPVTEIKPHDGGWQIRLFHTAPANVARCKDLRRDTAFGGP